MSVIFTKNDFKCGIVIVIIIVIVIVSIVVI
jgi:hypothetical protein